MGLRGAVATSQPLAAQAGLSVLQRGGNAVDAAVAAAAALVVLEPTSNGLGGDAFALVWDGRDLRGLNASGRAPRALTAETVRRAGYREMPTDGWLPVTVPGAVSAWVELSRSLGSMPLSELLRPAIEYAAEGYPVSPIIAGYWRAAEKRFAGLAGRAGFARTFLPAGRAPLPGEIFRNPDLARALTLIADSDGDAFYRGELAVAMAAQAERDGGYLTAADLADHAPVWVAPIATNYRGYNIWEIPPNGQGLTALLALNILEGYDLAALPQLSPGRLHLLIEALKLAFADAHAYIADPELVPVPTGGLLAKSYAAERRSRIDPEQARANPLPGLPHHGDTVYLCTADRHGMMVSYIQSNYLGFGSGIVIPGTGIALQNRGACFSLLPGHPNELAPGKRPFHTIIPGFITRDGRPLCAFGVMGGDMQPQGHVQIVSGLVDYRLNPQAALDAPRVRVTGGAGVEIELEIGADTIRQLGQLGHNTHAVAEMAGFGGGQIIWREPESGVLIAGSEPRKDGQATVY